MSFGREKAATISLGADYAVTPSSNKHAALPKYRYAIRVTLVLAALFGDILLIGAAALTAAFLRFGSLSTNTDDLLLITVPVFLLAAFALDCYRTNTLTLASFSRTNTARTRNRRRTWVRDGIRFESRNGLFTFRNRSHAATCCGIPFHWPRFVQTIF
jgi:hypothetical protein